MCPFMVIYLSIDGRSADLRKVNSPLMACSCHSSYSAGQFYSGLTVYPHLFFFDDLMYDDCKINERIIGSDQCWGRIHDH